MRSCGATIQACSAALEEGLSANLAGADPFFDDRFGRLALSKEGLAERDRMVFRGCGGRAIPVAVTMGGGYARNVSDTVDIHFQSVKMAVETARKSFRSAPIHKRMKRLRQKRKGPSKRAPETSFVHL